MAVKNASSTINTDYMTIEGNMIKWSDTIIQISNISIISTANVASRPFPFLSALLGICGLIMIIISQNSYGFLDDFSGLGIFMILAMGVWIFAWYVNKKNREGLQKLNILTNAGLTYTIIFNDKKFLTQVMKRFAEILSVPNNKESFTINIKDNVFRDGAQANVRM
ncbi:MAG: hypothetical protein ABFC73_08900 [Clostridiaceae bacterium]